MRIHVVKSWPEFFEPVRIGTKKHELRLDDRNYIVGDILELHEYDDRRAQYTGRKLRKRITYKTAGVGPSAMPPLRGLSRDYCILSLGDE